MKKKQSSLNTCGLGREADFWSITNHINLNKSIAEVINVDVEAELTLCDDPVTCTRRFTRQIGVFFELL